MLNDQQKQADTASTPAPAPEAKQPELPLDEVTQLKMQLETLLKEKAERETKDKQSKEERDARLKAKKDEAIKDSLAKGEKDKVLKMYEKQVAELKKATEDAAKKAEQESQQAKAYRDGLKTNVELQLSNYQEADLKAIKALSSWKDDDPIAQIQAIKDYSVVKGSLPSMKPNPFHAGTPAVGDDALRQQALQTGDFKTLLNQDAAKLMSQFGWN